MPKHLFALGVEKSPKTAWREKIQMAAIFHLIPNLNLGIADIIRTWLGIINLNNTNINNFKALLSLWQIVQIVSFAKAQQKPH